MLDVRTVFLTPGWEEWSREFLGLAARMIDTAPPGEQGWGSVGERPAQGGVCVTIERQTDTLTMDVWSKRPGDAPETWRYEKLFNYGEPTPQEVANEVREMLALPART